MSRKAEEVAVEFLHVDRKMGDRLGAVHDDLDAALVGDPADFFDWRFIAEHIGYLGESHDLYFVVERLFKVFDGHPSLFVQGDVFDLYIFRFAGFDPRQHAGGMLSDGREHDIAFMQPLVGDGHGQDVQAFGRSGSKHDFFRTSGVNEFLRGPAGAFIGVVDLGAHFIVAPVRVGAKICIVMDNGVDHLFRFEGGGAVVEIDEWMSAHFAFQDREIFADLFDIFFNVHKFRPFFPFLLSAVL